MIYVSANLFVAKPFRTGAAVGSIVDRIRLASLSSPKRVLCDNQFGQTLKRKHGGRPTKDDLTGGLNSGLLNPRFVSVIPLDPFWFPFGMFRAPLGIQMASFRLNSGPASANRRFAWTPGSKQLSIGQRNSRRDHNYESRTCVSIVSHWC